MDSRTLGRTRRVIALAGLAALLFAPATSNAGVVNGVQKADGLTINLGVVPASAVKRAHPQMHGGTADRSIHNMHLVAAIFDASGTRVTNATVVAHIYEQGGREWNVPLRPMTVNGALTYGGYTTFPRDSDYRIGIIVQRAVPKRRHPVTVHFTWAHD
ncbi:hypothetical protein GCM10011349_12480 [Novosphingobium indicum]|uniref:DUF4426 domain-containing protein n=1 Tax=Novosphingobium indicum TaxID=462949 RepID=A0ABQ2JFN8_9SPHN|nr:hypothetical protein [Novosphingobium indicum]GGN45922.1 hypothetical protein GCM10011349_12480 [Novosphingobium indicum]